jgi:hypothetical protein
VWVHAHQDVFDDSHISEQADILERARDAAFCDLIGAQANQGSAIELNVALLWPVNPGHGVEEGRLAGTIRTNDADNLAFFQFEIHFVDGR